MHSFYFNHCELRTKCAGIFPIYNLSSFERMGYLTPEGKSELLPELRLNCFVCVLYMIESGFHMALVVCVYMVYEWPGPYHINHGSRFTFGYTSMFCTCITECIICLIFSQ